MQNPHPVLCDRCRAQGVAGEGAFTAMKPLLDFTPVPRRQRRDGWTAERQRAFIQSLAATGSVKQAAKAINMSPEGAYYLRRQPGAEQFRAAWDAAIACGADIVDGEALDRAVNGVPVPIFHKGEQVGERRVFNERLTMFMLQHRKPETYGHAKRGTDRAEDLAEAEEIRQDIIDNHEAWMASLAGLYRHRVGDERRERLRGNVPAADFYLRQLTHMEVLLELGGGGKHLLFWANGNAGSGPGASEDKAWYATEVTEALDAHRREMWAEADPPEPDRPALTGNRGPLPSGFSGGHDSHVRRAKLADARERAAAAQKMWEEAVRDQALALAPHWQDTQETATSPFRPRAPEPPTEHPAPATPPTPAPTLNRHQRRAALRRMRQSGDREGGAD